MPWWGWIVLGVGLLAAELTLVDLQFHLVFIGAAALVVGGVGLAGIEQPVWLQWVEFSVLALVGTFWFRGRVYARLRPPLPGLDESIVGDLATAVGAIAASRSGRVRLRGSTWRARNVGAGPIAAGAEVRVRRLDGVVLEVESPDAASEEGLQ